MPAEATSATKSADREDDVGAQPAAGASVRRTTRLIASQTSEATVEPRSISDGPVVCALPLPQQIADHLGHLIMNGECRPGSRLKEEVFAERYQVSRGPVREALRILERRGFVEIVPRHGARVRVFDPAELASLFSVRAVLLGLAAREATARATPALLDRLADQIARLHRAAEAGDVLPRDYAALAGDAYRIVAQNSGNRTLSRMMDDLTGRTLWRMAWRETPLDFTTRGRRQQSARLWGELLRAMTAGDAAGAERIARTLIEASRDSMLSAMAALGAAREQATRQAPTRRRGRRNPGKPTAMAAEVD
jgi:DNA-binding GntR family transcriptional regulator